MLIARDAAREPAQPARPALPGVPRMIQLTPVLLLLVISILIVIVARRLHVPYTIALVILGFGLGTVAVETGYIPLTSSVSDLLAPGLFFDLLLPPIIFEAALNVNFRLLRRRAGLILFLAFVGVVFTTLFTGALLAYLTVLPLIAALLLAAILSPTDPIAIVDLFRRLRVPEELATIVESESLLNDATGIILFVVLLQVAKTGVVNVAGTSEQFALLVLGGTAIGLLVAGLVYLLHRQLNDPMVETAITVVAAYGSFLLANAIGASGIISCAIAGIAVGTWVAPRAIQGPARQSIAVFWAVIVYIANSLIFLAMGVVLALRDLADYVALILGVYAILSVGRALFVYVHAPVASRMKDTSARLPNSWYNVIAISGIRGAIPVVLALELLTTPTGLSPATVQAVVATALGVSLVSIVAGNITADWYIVRTFPPAPEPTVPPPGPTNV
jgi:monovalent cation:H+ antiporter, CPA1 family